MKKLVFFLAVALTAFAACNSKKENRVGKIIGISFMLPDMHTTSDEIHITFYRLIKTKKGQHRLLNLCRGRDTCDFNPNTLQKNGERADYWIAINGDTVMRNKPYLGKAIGDTITVGPEELETRTW
ncbi:MAG: hypothetical protein ABIO57_02280 [Candidatus Paceibacterota bacterium]